MTVQGDSVFSVKDSNSVERARLDSNGNMVIKGGLRLNSAGIKNTTPETLIVDGNVGIGTTSPTTKLDVAGSAQMTGSKLITSPMNSYISKNILCSSRILLQ